MENTIRITLPEVAETAAAIRNHNATLDDILTYVSRIMHELNSIWLSDGEEMLLSRFQKFSGKFIDEYEVIDSYARFLDSAVNDYDSLESTIVANASNFA
ncbi:MAG: WXG100 family type VII secretion target [Erysipelotrichaceae bacterium]|nr:WXG100 family type VII secretion target [Erysipelotrichaceae bacterium]MBQ1347559.1 WXG100 family type VII secretion target [Erysipelotrichaceae bacterium]